MPAPQQVIRAAVGLPLAVVRRFPGGETLAGLVERALPGDHAGEEIRRDRADERARRVDDAVASPGPIEVDPEAAADAAMRRERDPLERAASARIDEQEHVEAEVELVAESADLGATEPPGAELHVAEPWEGYRRMKVAEIKAQLEGQSREVLAAVELYEATHRARQGVLSAVELELKRASGPAAR